MPSIAEIVLAPEHRHNQALIRSKAARQAGLKETQISHVEILKSSLDARSKEPVFRLRVEIFEAHEVFTPEAPLLPSLPILRDNAPRVLIIGAGPAGYFAALELIEQGIRPIVLDRGSDARTRRRDLRAIQQFGLVNPHSNYCFGEGGAGTYSDGKLYTRSVKRGDIYKSLRLLVEHGAQYDILTEAHPHIGSNKLPEVVQNIRATILRCGGEVHFGQWVSDLRLREGRIIGVTAAPVAPTTDAQVLPDPVPGAAVEWMADAVILATGHSARDIYQLCYQKGIRIEAKPFALGIRVEHPQSLVDTVQYRQPERDKHLPAASYSLVCQVQNRGVFSFCMCPGGLVVPAATAAGEIVVNGMSMSRRDSPFANSGIVTAIEPEDLQPWAKHGVFAHAAFQSEVEQRLFSSGDGSQKAPALRLPDFIAGKVSSDLPASSYIPGLFPAPLFELLPTFVYRRLREGLANFGKQMKGFNTREANVIGTESRTSAPIRIPRDADTLMHPDVEALFPCGEGAGYAGGILSAAMDGQRCAKGIAQYLGVVKYKTLLS